MFRERPSSQDSGSLGVYPRHLWQYRAPESQPGFAPSQILPCLCRPACTGELERWQVPSVSLGRNCGLIGIPGEGNASYVHSGPGIRPTVGSQNGFSTRFSMTRVGCVALAKVHSVRCLAWTLVMSLGSVVERWNPTGGVCPECEPREVEESDSQGVADLADA